MKPPEIHEAKQLAYDHRAHAAIVLLIDGQGRVAGASYGMSRNLCRAAGKLLDGIIEGLERGTLGEGIAEALGKG